jgi:glyoxylase-like metal-dependent hydrolase (beta-lactamase superfamily II)
VAGDLGPAAARRCPTETTFGNGKLEFAGRASTTAYLLQAHTDGDLYVHFRDANVIVAGGAVSAEGWPVIDYKTGGWLGGLVEGLRDLIKVADANTKIVPANGPVITKADLEEQRAMYAAIFDRLGKLLRKGMGPEEVLAANPTREFDAKWGDPTQFVTLAFKSLWGHFAPDA